MNIEQLIEEIGRNLRADIGDGKLTNRDLDFAKEIIDEVIKAGKE